VAPLNLMDDQLRTEFNEWARAGKGESMEKGHGPVGRQAIQLMRVPADARVLDVGCGSGWATRALAGYAINGQVTGIDISDEMIRVARESSAAFPNADFEVASAEQLPFTDSEFTHAFSMESLYYYENISEAVTEIHRVLRPGGLFVAVMDLYWESEATHQWIDTLKVPVELLSVEDYRSLFVDAGFVNIRDQRLFDPTPIPENYAGGSFKSRADFEEYRRAGSLMVSGEVG
jgi:ubiquinone/menaquinone biosynthesis C-methylase UbiE